MDRVSPCERGETMNLILLRKELLGLRLSVLLVLAFTAFNVVYVLVTGFPDMQPRESEGNQDFIITIVFFGLIIGVSVLAQEREQQTQSFLDGLPLSRRTVFLYKTLAALLVMSISVVLPMLLSLLFYWMSQNSLSEEIPWNDIAVTTALGLLLGVTVVAVAMMLSFLRQWFPLVAGLVLWAFVWFRASGSEWVSWLDTSALLSTSMTDDGELQLPWKSIAGHTTLAVLALLVAGISFQWRDGRINRWFERLASWRLSGWLTGLGRLLAVGVWFFAIYSMGRNREQTDRAPSESRAAGDAKPEESTRPKDKHEVVGFATHETRHFEIVFRESQRKQVKALLKGLDQVHDQVTDFFQQAPPSGERIVVDVASIAARHAAGVTNWTKIRIPLTSSTHAAEFHQILRHETAHVYIEQLSRGRTSDHFNAMRSFHEGVATATELAGNDEPAKVELLRMERWAAASDSRGRVKLETLCNNKKLTAERDPALVYPLGYVFAQALIDTGGASLPQRVLTSLHESPPPPGVSPSELWRHVLQKSGTSFDHVIAAYGERLNLLQQREKLYLALFPRLSGEVSVEGDEIVIRPLGELMTPVPAKLICMVEKDLGIMQSEESVPMNIDGTFHIPRSSHSGNKLRYMLGWNSKEMRYPVFEPWAETAVRNF